MEYSSSKYFLIDKNFIIVLSPSLKYIWNLLKVKKISYKIHENTLMEYKI